MHKIVLAVCVLTCLLGSIFCYVILPARIIRPETDIKTDLKNLTPSQLTCVKKFVGLDQVLFVEPQINYDFISVGYLTEEGIYGILLNLQGDNSCDIEWLDKLSPLTNYQNTPYDPVFEKMQIVELTGDKSPEIYIWLDLYGVPQRGNARHMIYTQQADGVYEKVYETALCLAWGTVSFIPTQQEGQPRVLVDEDIHCEYRPSVTRSYYEFVLTNDGVELIRSEIKRNNGQKIPEFEYSKQRNGVD